MDMIADNMIEHLKSIKKNVIDVKQLFYALSLDTISYCAFGIETNSFKDPNNVLMKRCSQVFSDFRLI